MRTLKVGQTVEITSSARTARGRVLRALEGDKYEVRLPNWLADGVHKDVTCDARELRTGVGRAEVCRCVYCPGYRR